VTYQPANMRRVSADPRVQIHPAFLFARFEFTVNAAATRTIQLTQLDPFPAAFQNWLLGPWNVLSFAIRKQQAGSAMLRVDQSYDGNTFDHAWPFPLTGSDMQDYVTGFDLAGFCARFIIQNGSDSAASLFTGWVKVSAS